MLINSPNISGSLKVTGNTVITGSLTVLGGINATITGSATSASYVEYSNVANKPTLVSGSTQVSFNGITDKPTLVSGSSQVTYSGLSGIPAGIVSGSSQVSFNGIVDKPTLVSGSAQISFNGITDKPTLVSGSSQITYSGLSGIPSGIVSSSAQVGGYGIFATTGSNTFIGNQTITGSVFGTGSLTINGCITATGQIVAQTINIQQVTSSIVYSCGSNIFGTDISNTQQFTGSMLITGSNITANVGTACFQGNVCASTLVVNKSNPVLFINAGNNETSTIGFTQGAVAGYGGFIKVTTGLGDRAMTFGLSAAGTNNDATELIRLDDSGVTCFSNQVCASQFRANVGGCGCIAFFSTNGNIVFDNASISAIGNMGSNASQFSVSSRGCLTFRVGENGDPSAAPLRFLMDTNGIACFACQVCTGGNLINSVITNVNDKFSLGVNSTCYAWMQSYGGRSLYINALGNNVVLPNNTTRLSIGTCTPSAKLHIDMGSISSDTNTIHLSSTDASGTNKWGIVWYSGTGADFRGKVMADNNGKLYLDSVGGGGIILNCNGGSGNVGIGTTNPTRALTVSGKAQLTSTSNTNELYLADACTSIIDNQWIGSIGNNITIGAGGFHRMNIASTGITCFACRVCSAGLTVTGDICFGIGTGAYDQVIMCYSGYNGGSPLVTIMPTTVPGGGSLTTQLLLKSNGLGGGSGCNHMGLHTQGATYLATCNGGVGIGTTAPNYKLEVNGNSCFAGNVAIGGSYCAFALNVHGVTYQIGGSTWVQNGYGYVNSGATTTGLFPLSDNTIQLRIANSAALTIDSTQKIGIGSTTPQTRAFVLGLAGGQVGAGGCGCSTYSGGGKPAIYNYFGDQFGNGAPYGTSAGAIAPYTVWYGGGAGGYFRGGDGDPSPGGGGAGIVVIGGDGSSYAAGGAPYAEGGAGIYAKGGCNLLTGVRTWAGYFDGPLYACGNVGIGTTSPCSKLHIVGDGDTVTLQKSNNVPALAFLGTSTNKSVIEARDSFNFYTSNGSRMCIASTGITTFTCQVCAPIFRASNRLISNFTQIYNSDFTISTGQTRSVVICGGILTTGDFHLMMYGNAGSGMGSIRFSTYGYFANSDLLGFCEHLRSTFGSAAISNVSNNGTSISFNIANCSVSHVISGNWRMISTVGDDANQCLSVFVL
jgi:hypothetical protein